MNKELFIRDLKKLLEEYKMDKITGLDSRKLAETIFWLLYTSQKGR